MKKKKIKIANILEEARVGGPQIRLLLLANKFRRWWFYAGAKRS